jgi:hypothetical protein
VPRSRSGSVGSIVNSYNIIFIASYTQQINRVNLISSVEASIIFKSGPSPILPVVIFVNLTSFQDAFDYRHSSL